MITMTWGTIRDRDFQVAIDKVIKQPMGFELGQKFVLIGRELKKQKSLLDECHEKLLKEFAKPDPKAPGNYLLNEGTQEKFNDEMKKLLANRFDILVNKIDSLKLSEKIDLSPQDWIVLEPLFKPIPPDLKAVPGATNVNDQNKKQEPTNNANA